MRQSKHDKRIRRHRRVRARIQGTASRPRLSVYRSNKHVMLQLIDDEVGKTLVAVSDREVKGKKTKSERSYEAGKLLAERAQKLKISRAVFDRGGYRYHGRIQRAATGARENGLTM